jgi:predicted Na+-dependent transporter
MVSSLTSAALSNLFLFLLIFGLSATVHCRRMQRHVATNRRAMAMGLVIQYIVLPLAGFGTVTLATRLAGPASFTPPMGLLLLVVTSSPGGSFSNWWCSTWNADLALSVTMSTVSSVVSIFALPANIFIYSYWAYGNGGASSVSSSNPQLDEDDSRSIVKSLDYTAILVSLLIALTAMLSGLVAGTYFDTPRFHGWCNRLGTASGLALVVCLLVLSAGNHGNVAWWDQPWCLYVATSIPCVLGVAVSHCLAWWAMDLTPPERVTMVIECCYQNTGLATSMAITMYASTKGSSSDAAADAVRRAQALAVPMVYGILEALLVGLYGWYAWKAGWTKAPANASACVVWTTSYELEANNSTIDHQEEEDQVSCEIKSHSSPDDKTADTVVDEDLLEEIDLVVC